MTRTRPASAHADPFVRHTAIFAGALAILATAHTPAEAGRRKDMAIRADYAPVVAPVYVVPPANGSIFQPANGYAPLTSGARAAMVGDMLTIALVERTQAVKTNSASTDRNGNISITPPATGPLSFFKPSDVGTGAGAKFDGKGAAAQSNTLNGEITVTVAQVLPNGVLVVRGEKSLTLNRGDEFIRFSGLVRPTDIGPDNRVPSTRVADARITYSGQGEIARASRQGWLGRFFSRVSPF